MSPETTGEIAVETLKRKGNFQSILPVLASTETRPLFMKKITCRWSWIVATTGVEWVIVSSPRLPDDRAGVLVQAQHRFARPAAADEDQVAIDGHRGGAVPADVPAMMLLASDRVSRSAGPSSASRQWATRSGVST